MPVSDLADWWDTQKAQSDKILEGDKTFKLGLR